MPWPSPHAPETREAVEALLRETDLSMTAIAARTGVPRATITTWNGRGGWRRPTRVNRGALSPANWPRSRLEAIARLYYEPRVDPGDLAEAIGVKRCSTRALFLACGLTKRRSNSGAPRPAQRAGDKAVPALEDLNAALRGHAWRQIAAFDEALLGTGAAVIDSARVLRDLGGLKRLIEDLAGNAPAESSEDGGRVVRQDPSMRTLAELRETIARRWETFAAQQGEPAAEGGEPR